MSGNVRAVAIRFVDLVLEHEQWDQVTYLHIDDLNIMLGVVVASSFEARAVRKGAMLGHFLNRNGFKTDETFTLNNYCRFKVVGQNGVDNRKATVWLNAAVYNVRKWHNEDNYSREDVIEIVVGVIEDSIPLQPIRLNNKDDYLCEYTLKSGVHMRDTDDIDSCAGIHKYCGGWVNRLRQSSTYDQIVCRTCYRCLARFPMEIKSYGELRRYLKEHLIPQSNIAIRIWENLLAVYHRFW